MTSPTSSPRRRARNLEKVWRVWRTLWPAPCTAVLAGALRQPTASTWLSAICRGSPALLAPEGPHDHRRTR
eukprot:12928152-Heterocapsa_arctica.AAC.1